jgi:hypothetical protein
LTIVALIMVLWGIVMSKSNLGLTTGTNSIDSLDGFRKDLRWLACCAIFFRSSRSRFIPCEYLQTLTRNLLANIFPQGATFYLSQWYPRDRLAQRFAIFVSGAGLGGAFGGILAFAIQHMDG